MSQRKLYKTLETAASKNFGSDKELLVEIVNMLVEDENINVDGGRVWQLNKEKMQYKLLFQSTKGKLLENDFSLSIIDYDVFKRIGVERTVLAEETNKDLIGKGIHKYSASGIGQRIQINDDYLYEYVIALHSTEINRELKFALNIVATVLTAKLRERWLSESRTNMKADLTKAQQLQRSILPEHTIKFADYDIFGITIPALELGGDFFDYLPIGYDENRLGIVLGDAASKGLAAAAEAMYISGAIRMASTFQLKISPMMNRINQLVNKIFSDDRFTTMFYCEISNDRKGLCLYGNAGHNPPLFVHAEKKELVYLKATGPLLGPAPKARVDTDSINFLPNDVLVIFSDGITEAANEKFDMYEEARLEKVVIANMDKSAREIALAIMQDVNDFSTSESLYQDDKTIVVIKKDEKL